MINGVVRLTVTKRQRERQARSPKVVLEAQTKPQCLGHGGADFIKSIAAASLWCCWEVVKPLGVGFRKRMLHHCVLPLKGLLGFASLSVSFFWLLTGHEAISFSTMPFQYDVLAQKKRSKWPVR